MSGGAFEIEYVVLKCFGGSYIYMCVLCVFEGFIGMLCDIYAELGFSPQQPISSNN